ncbi:lytic murein transglycosylase [Lentibacter sp.]|uniref:lytic murein transglycosylase n=1 Tax=Lentibacter sp. TaxID=2024994 RepID=UPI003F6B9CAC
MRMTRRSFAATALAFAASPVSARSGFESWLRKFKRRAARKGISERTLEAAFAGVTFLPKVVANDARQAEVAKPLQDYLASAAGGARLSNGQKALKRHNSLLSQIERRYGVEKEVLTAIWGMESAYGGFRGSLPVFSTLATLAFEGRRRNLFEAELLAALQIVEAGHASPDEMRGSFAGAMGHTQFMPSTYQRYAQDYDGSGHANIWGDAPTDALASTAALLKAEGWRKGQPWAVEVRLPQGFDLALTGRIYPRHTREWARLGVAAATGGALPDHGKGALILPAGPESPVFLIYDNFHVIKKYNYADSYAIGVGHLSDRLAGRPTLRAKFSQNPWGMNTGERQALQQRLNARGFAAGTPDGVIGEKGRAAIRAYEQANGRPVTGVPSKALLASLG